ncbi:MAG: hypothetical protein WB460_15225 [Candidatus Acidiferrales bacterium]
MASEFILCRTRLEEAAVRLRELVTSEEYGPDAKLRLAAALGHIEEAIEVLRLDAMQGPDGA